MKYLLSYMTMILAMIVTLLVGGGFTSIIGVAILVLSQVHSFGMSG